MAVIFIKFMGAVCIILSCGAWGVLMGEKNKYRLQDMEEFKKAVSYFKGSVCAMGMPLNEAFDTAAQRTNGAVSKIFSDASQMAEKHIYKNASDIWNEAVKNNAGIIYFDGRDMEAVYSFGNIAGFADRNEQKENADILINEISAMQKEIAEKNSKDQKMYRSLSIGCGLLICIILF